MPRGPFGFPRLTDIASLVESNPSTRQSQSKNSIGSLHEHRKQSLEQLKEVDDRCGYLDIWGFPIEMIVTSADAIQPLSWHDTGFYSTGKTLREIKSLEDELETNTMITVHETVRKNAPSIMSRGFINPDPRGQETIPLRSGSAFFWVHDTDIGMAMPDPDKYEPASVVCRIDLENATVASNLGLTSYNSGIINTDEYEEYYSMPAMDYIDCLRQGHNVDPHTHSLITLLPNKHRQ